MSMMIRNRLVCVLTFIGIFLCLLITIRCSCNLIHANDTARQLMEQLHEKDRVFGVVLDQLMDLDHEMFFAARSREMKPVSYDKAAECLENLEGLNTSANFGRPNTEQSLRGQIGQVVNMGHDLIAVSSNENLDMSEEYQEMITGCIKSLEESRDQYTSEMIDRIKSAEKNIIRSAIMILVSVVVSAVIVVSLLILYIRQEKLRNEAVP